jgi:hypothetical protein
LSTVREILKSPATYLTKKPKSTMPYRHREDIKTEKDLMPSTKRFGSSGETITKNLQRYVVIRKNNVCPDKDTC